MNWQLTYKEGCGQSIIKHTCRLYVVHDAWVQTERDFKGDLRILVNVWDGDHGRIGQNRPEISKKNKQNNKRMIRRFYKIKLYNV